MIEAQTLALIVECLGMLENPENDTEAGFLQIQPVMVAELNRMAKREKWTLEDRKSRTYSTIMAIDYLLEKAEDMDVYEVGLLWRLGPTGMRNPTDEARDYAQRLVNLVESRRQTYNKKEE